MKIIKLIVAYISLIASSGLHALEHQYHIIFVHIGTQLPSYIKNSVMQARLFNPHADIIVIANEEALNEAPEEMQDLARYVTCESIIKTAEHDKFIAKSTLDRDSLNGFWTYTSERFYYLYDFMQMHNLHNVFHLENDVMLYMDLEKHLSIFKYNYPGIAAIFDNDHRCIPSFMYIAHPFSLGIYIKFSLKHLDRAMNDMESFAFFQNHSNKSIIDHLPIIPPAYANKYPLISPNGCKGKDKKRYFNHFDLFNSIFDAAAIGQYLGGISPINGGGNIGFINESAIFNPSRCTYEWIKDEQGRKVPYAVFKSKKYRINNLHIHSKNLHEFMS